MMGKLISALQRANVDPARIIRHLNSEALKLCPSGELEMRIFCYAFILVSLPSHCSSLSFSSFRKSYFGPRLDTDAETETSWASAKRVGVEAPWNAPKFVWRWAWKFQERMIPLLHRWDDCRPSDTCVNLCVNTCSTCVFTFITITLN